MCVFIKNVVIKWIEGCIFSLTVDILSCFSVFNAILVISYNTGQYHLMIQLFQTKFYKVQKIKAIIYCAEQQRKGRFVQIMYMYIVVHLFFKSVLNKILFSHSYIFFSCYFERFILRELNCLNRKTMHEHNI